MRKLKVYNEADTQWQVAGEENENTFSAVSTGTEQLQARSKSDTLSLKGEGGVILETSPTSKKVIIKTVNGTTFHKSTSRPQALDGNDGDVWLVYGEPFVVSE